MSPKSSSNVDGESDGRKVPANCLNKDGRPSAEGREGKRPTKENTEQTTASETQSWINASSDLLGVREVARRERQARFTALLHHVAIPLLLDSFYALKRDAAPGVDGVTWKDYETDLNTRLLLKTQHNIEQMPNGSCRNGKNRMQKFGLELHPDKTRLIEFGRYAAERREQRGEGKPETFNFLGFTHICGKTRKSGRYTVTRKTIRKRFSAKLKEVTEALRRRWHEPVVDVGKWLRAVVQGYFNYYAVPGNIDSLDSFRTQVIRQWHRALRRRSQKSRMPWARFEQLVVRWVPTPKILHPYPDMRFDAKHPR